jgi:hypothetical protein
LTTTTVSDEVGPSQIAIQVDQDHLEKEARTTASKAIAELIWNSLDADADTVSVNLIRNSLGAIEKIEIVDDGHGISVADAKQFFSALGGSWKKIAHSTRGKQRNLHGKEGKGRLTARGKSHFPLDS